MMKSESAYIISLAFLVLAVLGNPGVYVADCNASSPAQHFSLETSGHLRSSQLGLCLDVPGCVTPQVDLYECCSNCGCGIGSDRDSNLKWDLQQGGGALKSRLGTRDCLTVAGTSVPPSLRKCGSPLPATQTWRFVASPTNGSEGILQSGSLCLSSRVPSPSPLLIDPARGVRGYDGHGALSAGASSRLLLDYPEPQRATILDYLFKPGFGASLHHLKVEIGGDTWSTDGSEPSHMHVRGDLNLDRGWEFWLLKEAKKRRPEIKTYALPWGLPGWVGDGSGQGTGFYSLDNIYNYTLPFLRGARERWGVELDYLGIWNERDITNNDYVKELRQALNAHNFSKVKLVVSDNAEGKYTSDIEQAMQKDPALNASVSVVGLHYPRGNPDPVALQLGKKLWASESLTTSADWDGTSLWARTLNQNFVRMNATSAIAWSLIWSVYPNLICEHHGLMDAWEPWSGYYRVAGQVWATAHTAMFVELGWRYLIQGSGSGLLWQGQGSYVTLVDDPANTTQLTTVIEWMQPDGGANATGEASLLRFSIAPGPVCTQLQRIGAELLASPRSPTRKPDPTPGLNLWLTNRTVSLAAMDPLPVYSVPGGGCYYHLAAKPNHLYTVTSVERPASRIGGGGNPIRDGGQAVPSAAAIVLPYSDGFEATAVGAPGRYFNDQEP